jgi:hypothetical protein
MLRWCVGSLLVGALAAAITCGVMQVRLLARTTAAEERAAALEAALEPDAEALAVVESLEAARASLMHRVDIVDALKERQPDLETVDRSVLEAAAGVAGIRLEAAEWRQGKVMVTVRADTVESLARIGEAFARHESFAATRIARWTDEEVGDRFVVASSWVPGEKPEGLVESVLRMQGDL